MKIFWVVVITVFYTQVGRTSEIFENWMSVRALGMGNAYSTIVDDRNALWYNPAGLDKIRGLHLTVLDMGIGSDAADVYSIYQNTTGSNYSAIIHQFFGRQVWLGLSDSLAFSMKDFAVAAYDYLNMSFNLHDPAYANLTFNVTNDIGFISGFAFSVIPQDILRLGVVAKRVTRYGGRVPFGPSTLATLSNSQLTALVNNYGTGYGLDVGLLFEAPLGIHPIFSAVWHDIGQTKFIPVGSSSSPPPMDNEAVAGMSVLFDATVVKIRPAIDFKHINLQDEQLGKRIHMGVELQFPGLAIRGGASQGYYTAGVGIDLKYLQIDAATYGVELDTYPGQLEDRRYVLQFTIDLNFDPSFDLGPGSSSGGRGFRAYQRR